MILNQEKPIEYKIRAPAASPARSISSSPAHVRAARRTFSSTAARSCAACTTAARSKNRTTISDASLYRGIQNSPIYTERFRRNHSVIPQRHRPRRLGRGEKSQVHKVNCHVVAREGGLGHAPAFFGHRRCPIECRAESAGFPPLLIIAPPNTYLC